MIGCREIDEDHNRFAVSLISYDGNFTEWYGFDTLEEAKKFYEQVDSGDFGKYASYDYNEVCLYSDQINEFQEHYILESRYLKPFEPTT